MNGTNQLIFETIDLFMTNKRVPEMACRWTDFHLFGCLYFSRTSDILRDFFGLQTVGIDVSAAGDGKVCLFSDTFQIYVTTAGDVGFESAAGQ